MKKLNQIINEVNKFASALNVDIYPEETNGNINENNVVTNPEDVDFKFSKRINLMFSPSTIGYSDMILYLDLSNELIALSLINYNPALIPTLQHTKSFYGVQVKRLETKHNSVVIYF